MRPFRLREEVSWPECLEVLVEGELDRAVAPRMQAALELAIGFAYPYVIVDLDRCEFIDAGGLAVIHAAHRQMLQAGQELMICGASGQVRRVIELTGVFEALPTGADRPSPVSAFAEA